MGKRHIVLGTAAVALLALGGAWGWMAWSERSASLGDCTVGRVAGGAIGGPFELVDETGETVTSEEIITEPTLVYFGYTFCPDVCPLDAMRNGQAIDILTSRGVEARSVFISVDPRRDTPEVVDAFTDNFHEEMIGLTGTPEQVDAAAKAYRVSYEVPADPEDDFYLVSHTVLTYLMLPERGFVDFFRRDATPEQVADTVQCVAEAV
ncbi:SCO family protein [Roseisalinus antarcticus]|uniref:SCO1/SenC n=1 Tax=Roseisalinus antarcticus TaxID=254357 RepID=A0A1Y5S219_9RHOB|nr:SCO family protein [Roseisalinus antarcticus]SLN30526.1 SCO1/SenC [Roseisalinus antarcticus]